MSDGRPFMTTCVPKSIYLTLKNTRVAWSAEWAGAHKGFQEEEGTPSKYGFSLSCRLLASADIDHDITVFTIPEGKVIKFDRIASVQVMSIQTGGVGGIHNATAMTGIGYSGMSSRDVPENGLMEGEPGGLFYVDATHDEYDHEFKGQRYLSLDVYMDENQFTGLCEQVQRSNLPISEASAHVNIELFEYEVDTSLSEPWHRHDFGLLLPDRENLVAKTQARLHNLYFRFGQPSNAAGTILNWQGGAGEEMVLSREPVGPAVDTIELAKFMKRYAQLMTAVGVAILVVLLLR